ncbi:hypothetical protein [Rummeliibacillus sp. SL167]|uniref:hypothetical protein n=1 Tax=Rummeliibacillus sp. SL167 TaxID=2579792 RepID=UPI00164924F5|nr:hypothetical protein [Rummeliibacillus sp. SL167]
MRQDVGPSGVATGRGAFHLSSSSSVGDEENPANGVSLYRLKLKGFACVKLFSPLFNSQ